MSQLAFALLWLTVFSIPGEQIVPIEGFGSTTRVIGAVAITIGVFYVLLSGSRRKLAPFHVVMLLFVMWSSVTTFWSIDLARTAIRITTYVQLAIFGWLIWELAWSRKQQGALLQAYVLGAYIGVLSTLYVFLSGSPPAEAGRYAAFDNPNELGATMALAIPMAWYLSLRQQRHRGLIWLNRTCIPLALIAVTLTASRAALIIALASLLIVPWTFPRLSITAKVGTFLAASGVLYVAGTFVPQASQARLRTTGTEIATGDLSGRGPIWRAGTEAFLRDPLVGVGAGTFPIAVRPILGYDKPSHMAYLSVAVEQGLVGLLLFMSMFAANLISLPRMPSLERKFNTVLILTLAIAMLPANWDYKKQPWFVLSLVAAQAAVAIEGRSRSSNARSKNIHAGSLLLRQ
jgi:O-antigen ligase